MSYGDRLTGKASYFTFGGVNIPITKATHKAERKLADTTDNGDYSQGQDLLTPTQLAVSVGTEFSIEGRYRRSVIPGALIANIYQSNPGGVMAYLGLDASAVVGHGYFDISDFQVDDPVDDTVTYTCTMKSNGPFTPGS